MWYLIDTCKDVTLSLKSITWCRNKRTGLGTWRAMDGIQVKNYLHVQCISCWTKTLLRRCTMAGTHRPQWSLKNCGTLASNDRKSSPIYSLCDLCLFYTKRFLEDSVFSQYKVQENCMLSISISWEFKGKYWIILFMMKFYSYLYDLFFFNIVFW